jgi:hypothetical protein
MSLKRNHHILFGFRFQNRNTQNDADSVFTRIQLEHPHELLRTPYLKIEAGTPHTYNSRFLSLIPTEILALDRADESAFSRSTRSNEQPKPHTASGYCYSGRLHSPRQGGIPATHGFPVPLVTADPSSCPFVPVFRRDIPGRSVFQAPMLFPGGSGISFR